MDPVLLMRRLAQFLAAHTLCLATGHQVAARDTVQIITSRSGTSFELYLALPTRLAIEAFGVTARDLSTPDGNADFDLFARGTFQLAEDFWGGSQTWIGGTAVAFEAMSLMIHPASSPLPFRTPLDAMTTIEVCGTVREDVPLGETWLYVGMIAYPDDPSSDLVIDFAKAFEAGTVLHIRDFTNHEMQLQSRVDAGADTRLVITANGMVQNPYLRGFPLLFILLCLSGLAYGATRDNGPFAA
ncbi:MAG: hypothetical protein AAFY31_02385 [Pseudomonadota bacterium]